MCGANLCLPKALPNKYAKPSLTETVVSKKITKTPPQISSPGIAMRRASKHVSKKPVYTAPKKLMQTSAIRACLQKTYQTNSVMIKAAVTKITPFISKKKYETGNATAAAMPRASLGSFASLRNIK